MHPGVVEWQLTFQLEDGSFAVFWLDIHLNGLTHYYDERGEREMRGLAGAEAAVHLMARLGHGDPSSREWMHRSCEFSGEIVLPLPLVARVQAAVAHFDGTHRSRTIRNELSTAIRLHFLRQAAPTLRHHRMAESHPLV